MNMAEKPPIKITHIASGDLWAGAEVQLFTLVSALRVLVPDPSRLALEVILLNHGTLEQKLTQQGIEVTVFDESASNGLQILGRLIRHIRQSRPDVIHTHRLKENILGSIAARLNGNINSVRTAHGAPEHRPSYHQLARRLLYSLDLFCGRYLQRHIVAVSDDLAQRLANDFEESHIRTIENGIDIERFTPHAHTADKHRRKIGIVGRLVPVKRIDAFIAAAQILLQDNDDQTLSFHIYGDGPLHDELMAQKEAGEHASMIHFEGHCDNLAVELQALDCLLMTSDHEGLPMTLLEAMALKVPVVAHAVGGIPILLEGGECGLLMEDNRPATIASAISQALAHPEQLDAMCERARRRIEQHYSARANAERYLELYRSLST